MAGLEQNIIDKIEKLALNWVIREKHMDSPELCKKAFREFKKFLSLIEAPRQEEDEIFTQLKTWANSNVMRKNNQLKKYNHNLQTALEKMKTQSKLDHFYNKELKEKIKILEGKSNE